MNFVVDSGSGPALLFLHGMPSQASGLEPLWRPLLARHRVLAPELPGYGKSPAVGAPYDVRRVNDLLEAELAARGVRELAGVVGFSLGAYRAFLLALDGKLPVGRIASLAGVARFDPEERPLLRQFAAIARSGPVAPALVAPNRERMLSPGFRERHPERAGEVDAWLGAAPSEVLADELEAAAASDDLLPRLASLRQPVLARVGEHDAACPRAKSEAIARAARQATLQVVPGAGHALEIEDPEGTAAALERFFA